MILFIWDEILNLNLTECSSTLKLKASFFVFFSRSFSLYVPGRIMGIYPTQSCAPSFEPRKASDVFFWWCQERFFGDSEISAIFWGKIVATFIFPCHSGHCSKTLVYFSGYFFKNESELNLNLHRLQSEVGHVSVPADCWDQSEAVLVLVVGKKTPKENLGFFKGWKKGGVSPTRSHFFSGG